VRGRATGAQPAHWDDAILDERFFLPIQHATSGLSRAVSEISMIH